MSGVSGQTAADLRALVARRCGTKRRVALLSSDPSLVHALEANGCTVLVDPPSFSDLGAFRPQVVVAFDGLLTGDARAALDAISSAAPEAELVLSFANAASASGIVTSLTGGTRDRGSSEGEIDGWLRQAGYRVRARDAVVSGFRSSGLAAETEAALRQLLEQLNPSAAVERFLVTAERGVEPSVPDRVDGLVSVVVTGDDEPGLTGTIASLLGQQRRPLELVLGTGLPTGQAEKLLERARLRANVSVALVEATSAAAQRNQGLLAARGQYLAFASAGELFTSMHLSALVDRLSQGTEAWAVAPSVRPRFSLPQWLRAGAVHPSAWLLDRSRLGRFPLTFAEEVPFHEALFFARLALLFRPAYEHGPETVERSGPPPAVEVDELLRAIRGRPLQGLSTLDELVRASSPPSVESLLEARLASADPRAKAAYERAKGIVNRVSQAWDDAKKR